MEPNSVSPRVYKFGPFELSVEAAELRKNGVRLKLQDQPFQILRTLLERPGELVSREELRQQLWPEGTFVDFEHGLNTAIKKIRDVLSDDAETPRYIETIPRKGYRFVANLNRDADQTISATPRSFWPRWPSCMPFLVGALAVVVGVVALNLGRIRYSPSLRISKTTQLTFTGDLAPYSTVETDGRRVYYFKYSDSHLYSVPVGGGAERSSATTFSQPLILHISPDGSLLLVKEMLGPSGGHPNRIWLLPTNGGAARPLGDIAAEFAAWSPDGKTIAFAYQNAIYVTEDEGAICRRLAATPGEVSWIRWSPDGQRLRFTTLDSRTGVSSTWEARRNGALARKLELFLDTCCGFWTREGRRFLFRELRDARTEYWIAEEDWSLFRSGKPSSLSGGGLEMIAATASPLENVLFVVLNQNSRMTFTFDLARRQLTPFLPELSVGNPAFSRDGKWMALCQVHTRQSILWRARSDGSEWLPLTDQRLWVHHARFSPDGKRIAFMAKEPNSPWKIYWVPAEGGALHKLDVPITNQADPNWAPDNQSIIFGQPPRYYAEPDAPRAIYIHNLQSGSVSKLPGSEGWFSPRVSPDGHRLLALSIDEHRLALHDFTNSQWRILVENPEKRLGIPSWSPDQEWAYVNTYYGKNLSLLRVRVRDGKSEEVLSFPKLIRSPYCWAWGSAPEGSLLINCTQPNANIYALRYE